MSTLPRMRVRVLAPWLGLAFFVLAAWFGQAWRVGQSQHIDFMPSLQGINLAMDLEYAPPDLAEQLAGEVRLKGFELSGQGPLNVRLPSTVCIDAIRVLPRLPNDVTLLISMGSGVLPQCYKVGYLTEFPPLAEGELATRSFGSAELPQLIIRVPSRARGPSWYPFDSLDVEFYMGVQYRLLWEDEVGKTTQTTSAATTDIRSVSVPSTMHWTGLEVDVVTAPAAIRDAGQLMLPSGFPDADEMLRVHLRRPLLQQSAFVIVVLVMFGFVILLSTIHTSAEFVEGGVAFFLGILGLRATLPLAEGGAITLVDLAVWALYFAFAATLAAFMLGKAQERRLATVSKNKSAAMRAGPAKTPEAVGTAQELPLDSEEPQQEDGDSAVVV